MNDRKRTSLEIQAMRRLALVRLSLKEPTQEKQPNYRIVGKALQNCGTCTGYKAGKCFTFGTYAQKERSCDAYSPNTDALRQAISEKHLIGKHDQSEHGRTRSGRGSQQSSSANGQQSSAAGDEEDEQQSSASGDRKGRRGQQQATEARRRLRKHKAALPPNPDYKSTQLDMPDDIKAAARGYYEKIPKADLTKSGIERDTHITSFFGLLPSPGLREKLEQIAATTAPITVELGKVSLFTDNDDFDVVKVEADSPGLRELNQRLRQLPNGNTRKHYSPHMTIAYVQKGAGFKYNGETDFNGRRAVIRELVLSERNPGGGAWIKTRFPFRGLPKPSIPQTEGDIVPLREKALAILKDHLSTSATPYSQCLAVYKDRNGDYRWVSLSSNAYRDRDNEIVSQKALEEDVAYADRTGDYGPLRFWHVKGWDVGDCDFNMMYGRTLIESGTFRTKELARRMIQVAPNYQISIGFKHPKNNPDPNGVYHSIRRFERSLVPAGLVANPFTRLVVKERRMNNAKLAAFKELFGEDAVTEILGTATATEKAADDQGVEYKEVNLAQLAESDPAEFLAFALKNYDAAQDTAEKEGTTKMSESEEKMDDDKEEKMGDDKEGDDEDATMKALKSLLAPITQRLDALEAAGVNATAQATAETQKSLAEASTLQTARIKQLEAEVLAKTKELETAVTELKDANAQPAAFEQGHRPTEATDNLTGNDVTEKATQVQPGSQAEFFNFLTQPFNNGAG